MSKQLNHQEFKDKQLNFRPKISIILENLEHDENIGSAFRLADAFNVDKILIVTNNHLSFGKIEKTARNCTKNIKYQIFDNTFSAINSCKQDGYVPVSLEICDDSKSLREYNFAKFPAIAIIVGNERQGVSQEALDLSEIHTHIDMYGNNSSMNVSTALAIALYKCSEDVFEMQNSNNMYL